MKPIAAIHFALNNNIAPRMHIKKVDWVPTKKQWKVSITENFAPDGAWSIGGQYHHKIYFDENFINRCQEAVERGITRWC
jgi:uncharacterized Zn finger protein